MLDQIVVPPRVTLTNTTTMVTLESQFNPEQLQEVISANYVRQTVPGLSHQPLQFVHTTNETFRFDMIFRALSPEDAVAIQRARRFFKSMCVPRGGSDRIVGGAPPRALLVWPRMLSLTTVITNVTMTHELFNRQMQTRRFIANVQLEEIRDFRMTSQQVFNDAGGRYGQSPSRSNPSNQS